MSATRSNYRSSYGSRKRANKKRSSFQPPATRQAPQYRERPKSPLWEPVWVTPPFPGAGLLCKVIGHRKGSLRTPVGPQPWCRRCKDWSS